MKQDANGFVDRPTRRNAPPQFTDKILATVENGRAVRIPLKGRTPQNVQQNLRNFVRRRGLVFVYRSNGDSIVAWCEKVKGR